jgi:hypothetical protein
MISALGLLSGGEQEYFLLMRICSPPPAVPDYRTPVRLLPAKMHPRLTNDEHTKMLKHAKAHQTHLSKYFIKFFLFFC